MRGGSTRRLIWLTAALCVATAFGWFANGWVRSPAQVVADTAPPPPSELTAIVTRAPLDVQIVSHGQVTLGRTLSVSLPPEGVLTSIDVKLASSLSPGQQVASINDRPVIVLEGQVPLWRDLSEGDAGRDVERFQRALISAGQTITDPFGEYGPSTAAAVRRLYEAVGSEPLVGVPEADMLGAPADEEAPPMTSSPDGGLLQTVPTTEIVMIPRFPAKVTSITASLGARDSERSILVALGKPEITAKLAVGDAEKIAKGASVLARSATNGSEWRGRVEHVAAPSLDEEDGYTAVVRIGLAQDLPFSMNGAEVQLTIKGKPRERSLLVPVTAIWQQPDGSSRLVVLRGGSARSVPVKVLGEANGMVAFVASGDEKVLLGDRVRVGTR